MSIEFINNNFLHIKHPKCDAIISLQGAQLISWTPKDKIAVLWATSLSYFKKGQAFRGGIPLCWPWFGKSKTPSHGFARLLTWKLQETQETTDYCHLTFTLSDTKYTRTLFPHCFNLTLKITLGKDVHIELDIDTEVETTGALHSYFSSVEVEKEIIGGLGNNYTDSLDSNRLKTQVSRLKIDKEVDRIYTTPSSITTITSKDRLLTLKHKNHSDIVVWNPWAKTSSKLSDMKQGVYKNMFCIETAKINKSLQPTDIIGLHITYNGDVVKD